MGVLKKLKNRGYNLIDDILSLMIYPQYRSHAQYDVPVNKRERSDSNIRT